MTSWQGCEGWRRRWPGQGGEGLNSRASPTPKSKRAQRVARYAPAQLEVTNCDFKLAYSYAQWGSSVARWAKRPQTTGQVRASIWAWPPSQCPRQKQETEDRRPEAEASSQALRTPSLVPRHSPASFIGDFWWKREPFWRRKRVKCEFDLQV